MRDALRNALLEIRNAHNAMPAQRAYRCAMKNDGSRLYQPREFNAVTKQRFFRDRRVGLLRHLATPPSMPQATLIHRIIRAEWDLLRLDARMDDDDLSAHAMRCKLAMENRLRLDLVALGLQPATPPAPTFADIVAREAATEYEAV
jgi:hypothetical protein